MKMNFSKLQKWRWNNFFYFFISILFVFSFFQTYCHAEGVTGITLSSKTTYETSLGKLKDSFLLQNGNKMGTDSSGNMTIIFGFIHMGSDGAIDIRDNVEIFQGKTNLSPNITFVQDMKSKKWVATNGTMCIDKSSTKLLDNSTVKIIGGKERPIKIAGQSFSDTTVLIKNGNPVEQKP